MRLAGNDDTAYALNCFLDAAFSTSAAVSLTCVRIIKRSIIYETLYFPLDRNDFHDFYHAMIDVQSTRLDEALYCLGGVAATQ
jgi:hypothetical protein